jgi:hypothetical protein
VKNVRDRLRIVSHFPGRLRVRAETFRLLPEVADQVARRVAQDPGVTGVDMFRATGSIVIGYEPKRIELPLLVRLIVWEAGLGGVVVDAPAAGQGAAELSQGERVRSAAASLNDSLQERSGGKVDMRTALPGGLAAGGMAMLLFGRRRMPAWYDLVFWALVTFWNLNASSAATQRGEASAP